MSIFNNPELYGMLQRLDSKVGARMPSVSGAEYLQLLNRQGSIQAFPEGSSNNNQRMGSFYMPLRMPSKLGNTPPKK